MRDPDPIFDRLIARMEKQPGSLFLGQCGADAIVPGNPVPEALQAQARENPAKVRIIRRGRPMTMDLRPDRLTIIVDDAGKVVSARCG